MQEDEKRFAKRPKLASLPAPTLSGELEAIAQVLRTAIGQYIPIPPLLTLIAVYAAAFVSVVTTVKSYADGAATEKHDHDWGALRTVCVVRSNHAPISKHASSADSTGSGDDDAALILCDSAYRFDIQSLQSGIVRPFCGSGERGFVNGSSSTTSFHVCVQACVDPIRSNCYYLLDRSSIRHFDQPNDKVTLVAGGAVHGNSIGCGSEARFGWIDSPLVTRDGKAMFVLDQSNTRVWRVDLTTRNVTVALEISNLVAIDMTWTAGTLPLPAGAEAAPLASIVTHTDGEVALLCCNFSAPPRTIPERWVLPRYAEPSSVVCTSAGLHLIASVSSRGIFSYDTRTNVTTRIAGSVTAYDASTDGSASQASFSAVHGIALDETGRCLYAVESRRVRKLTLPPEYFLLNGCCDRDR